MSVEDATTINPYKVLAAENKLRHASGLPEETTLLSASRQAVKPPLLDDDDIFGLTENEFKEDMLCKFQRK